MIVVVCRCQTRPPLACTNATLQPAASTPGFSTHSQYATVLTSNRGVISSCLTSSVVEGMVALTIKRSELLLFDDRTNETGLELPAVSHFLAMYGLCSYSGLYIKILLVSAVVRTAAHESVFSKYFLSLTLRECPPRQQKRARSGSQDKILRVLSHYYHNIKISNQTDILRVGCYSSEKRTGLLPRAITMILRCIVAASVLLLAHGLSFPLGRSR